MAGSYNQSSSGYKRIMLSGKHSPIITGISNGDSITSAMNDNTISINRLKNFLYMVQVLSCGPAVPLLRLRRIRRTRLAVRV